jgi:hypothetical protein
LNKVLAVFYETLRIYRERDFFPVEQHFLNTQYYAAAAYLSIREATEDIVLTLPNPVGEEGSTTMRVAKGTQVHCCHTNHECCSRLVYSLL